MVVKAKAAKPKSRVTSDGFDASLAGGERGGVPAYYRLYVLLAQRIRDRELEPGAILMSENQMVAEYGVSRITVRKAMDVLEKEGLINRRRGARSSVAEEKGVRKAPLVEGPIDNLLTRGLAAHAINLSVKLDVPPPEASKALGLERDEKCLAIVRLRRHGDDPFSYSRIYVSPKAADSLDLDDLGSDPILVQVERAGHLAALADQTISATLAQDPAATALKVPIGSALIQLRRAVFGSDGAPFLYQVSLYRPDQYEYHMRLSRESASTRPQWRHT